MEYTVDYFIKKFSNTRDNMWCINSLHDDGKSCANGWCGVTLTFDGKENSLVYFATPESIAMAKLFKPLATGKIYDHHENYSNIAAHINNGNHPGYQQPTPKQRILEALHNLKKMQQPTRVTASKEKTVYVSVPESITKQSKELILS